jgi:hypothetical protein
MLGEVIQPMKLVDHSIKVSPLVIDYVKQQRSFKHVMIMSINRYIINRQMKLMEMGGREEILLERISTTLIMQGIFLEVISTSSINPYLKGATIRRQRLIFICAQRLTTC